MFKWDVNVCGDSAAQIKEQSRLGIIRAGVARTGAHCSSRGMCKSAYLPGTEPVCELGVTVERESSV